MTNWVCNNVLITNMLIKGFFGMKLFATIITNMCRMLYLVTNHVRFIICWEFTLSALNF